MKRTITVIIMVCTFLFCSAAFAAKRLVYVSPNTTTFRVERQEDGMVRFTVVRDSADAHKSRNESLIPRRSAQLKVSNGERALLTAPIAPRVNDDGKLVYEFRVSKKHAAHSLLIIPENPSGHIGDGAIYKYSMYGTPEVLRKLFDKDDDRDDADSSR